MSILNRIFETGEKKAFRQIEGVVQVSYKANAVLKGIINKEHSIAPVRQLEKESDSERLKVSRMITSGAIAPNLLDDMILLVNKEEEITESIFKLSRQLLRYSIKDKKSAAYVQKQLLTVNQMSASAIRLLEQMHEQSSVEAMRKARSTIRDIEDEADIVRDELLDFAYNTPMDFKAFYHIVHLAYTYDSVLDDCKDASDLFISIILSIIT